MKLSRNKECQIWSWTWSRGLKSYKIKKNVKIYTYIYTHKKHVFGHNSAGLSPILIRICMVKALPETQILTKSGVKRLIYSCVLSNLD